jgi:PAS domain S-box-containing protein
MNTPHPAKPPLTDEQRFQYLIAGISDYAIYMLDPAGHVNSWNAGAQRFKGYKPHEILNEHFSRFYTPEDRASGLPARALAQALEQGKYEAEGWRVRKDGSRFWAHVVIDPIYDEDQHLLGFAKITRDVTQRKLAEDALRESEQRFRLLVQGVTDYAIYMLSPEGVVSNWNIGAERIKGYSYDEAVGSHFSRFYTPEDRESGMPVRALATAGMVGRYEAEGWRVRKDGTRFWAHVIIDAIHGDDGELVGFAKITRDLTEKKLAAEALEQAQLALFQSQKMESIGQLTGGIAHDFNNLLSVLSSGLEVLGMSRQSGGDAKTIDSMRRAIDRGATLTQQLLAFARQQPLQPETRSINRIISGFESVLRRAGHSGIEFELNLDPQAGSAVVDAARFESALLNLVVNARDAMPHGGTLDVSTTRIRSESSETGELPAGDYVRITVTDTGSGMPADVKARVFEPFYTTKPVGKGTGLGLSQVQGFIVQSGGQVAIDSTPGQGTSVHLTLPAIAAPEGAHEVPRTGSELVIIAEDEVELAGLAASLFETLGYKVLLAHTGADALRLLAQNPDADLLFSDVMMPGMTGIELAHTARSLYPKLKIILASGYAAPALREQGDIDAFDFVAKPYRLAEIIRKLR